MNRRVIIIAFVILANLSIIYQLIDAILSGSNIWFPILLIIIEIIMILIYGYVGQYGEKITSVDHNPKYGN